jgi:hypothetical protein
LLPFPVWGTSPVSLTFFPPDPIFPPWSQVRDNSLSVWWKKKESIGCRCMGLFLALLFYVSAFMKIPCYFSYINLLYILKSGIVMTPALFFLFNIASAILSPLCFHMNFF